MAESTTPFPTDFSQFPHHFLIQMKPEDPPALTEANLEDQSGKVFIVTGGNNGIGAGIVRILYSKNGTVYVASRSEEKARAHIAKVEAEFPESTGKLVFLQLVLDDLASAKAAAQEFSRKETRLDVLFNNAGVGSSTPTEVTVQGFSYRMGVNLLGHFVFTHHLTPHLIATTKIAPKDSVRVVWTASQSVDLFVSPNPNGVTLEEIIDNEDSVEQTVRLRKYAMSKLANWLVASEFAKRLAGKEGIVSITVNPGLVEADTWEENLKQGIPLAPAVFGSYTNLWAGLAKDVTVQDGLDGKYALPYGGIWHPAPREDVMRGLKSEKEGGTGVAEKFFDWAAEQVKEFL